MLGETLIKPAALKMANLILGTAAEGKLSQIHHLNDTISDRIENIIKDILTQVVEDLISSLATFSRACGISHVFARAPTLSCRLLQKFSLFSF